MNALLQAAYDSHPFLTILSFVPILFISGMLFLFTILIVSSAFRYSTPDDKVTLGGTIGFLFVIFSILTLGIMWYSAPAIVKHVPLHPDDAQVSATNMFEANIVESKNRYNYAINLLKWNNEYQDFANKLAANIPHGKKVDLEEVNKKLLPPFYSCFTSPNINAEISLYGIEGLISEKEKECSIFAAKKLLHGMSSNN